MSVDNNKKAKNGSENKKRGEYKVVFRGRLLDGFSKKQVVANIVQLTKIPKETVEKKFFSGKAVIIRRAHDEPHAQKLQQLFSNAGLEVMILKDAMQNPEHQTQHPEKKTKRELQKFPKRSILVIVLLVILISVGINFWNEYNINVEAPDDIVGIEQSLANESLVFLAHVNVERLLSLHHYFVDDPNALPGLESNFYNNLKKAGIDPEKAIRQMVAASYVSDKTMVTHNILLGHFSVQSVKQFLLKQANGTLIPDPDFVRIRIADIDPTTCNKGNFREVSIESDRILIATDGYLDELRRLLKKAPGNNTDLTKWASYRSDKLISVAMFKPEQGARLTSGLTAMMAQDVIKSNKPLNSLYASVGMQLLPPTGIVDISLNSQDQSWLEKTRAEFNKQISDMKNTSSGLPNLLVLLNKISVNQINDQLSINLRLDGELKQSIKLSLNEFGDKLFTMNSLSQKNSAQVTVKEQIEKQPLQFVTAYNKTQLKPFNEQFDQFFKPAWIEGPFAVGVDQLLLENDQVVLQLRGKGQNIDNIVSKQAKIKILAVNDTNGNNLLVKQTCEDSAVKSNESYFSSRGTVKTAYIDNKPVYFNELEVNHNVKLQSGVNFSQVKTLQAEIELELATETRKEQFALPEQNKSMTEYGARLFFKPDNTNTISYTISGDEKRILAVRALNRKKQYLSRSSSSSTNNLWGSGHSVSQTYYGEVAFVEVVYAMKMEKINYAVEITKFPPYPSEEKWKYGIESATASSVDFWNNKYDDLAALDMTLENNRQDKPQAQWHNGPFNLALYGYKNSKHWGTSGQLMIKTPVIDELRHNLSALEIYFHYPQATDNGELGKSYYHPLKAKGYYMNGEFVLDKAKPYMESQLSFSLPSLSSSNELTGDIIVHLPLSMNSNSYTDLSIGAQWEDEGVSAKIVRLGSDVMELEISGSRSRLLQIILLDAENQCISTSDVHYGFGTKPGEQKGNIVVNYHGTPVKAKLTVSEGQQTKRYPFQLKLQ